MVVYFKPWRSAALGTLYAFFMTIVGRIFAPSRSTAPNAASPHEVALRFGVPEESDGEGGSRAQKLLGVTAHSGDGIDAGVRWLVERLKSSPRAEMLMPLARAV